MDNEFNYISDTRTIAQLGRANILGSTLIFLPIGRNGHWSLATANTQVKKIYHEDPISGTHSDAGKDGASIMLQLLADVAKHNGEQFDTEEWTCQSSRQIDPPQQTGIIDCSFVCAYATLRQQE